MNKTKWMGTHRGVKKGKTLNRGKCGRDDKAEKRLAARKLQHLEYEKKVKKGRQVPGSKKKVC